MPQPKTEEGVIPRSLASQDLVVRRDQVVQDLKSPELVGHFVSAVAVTCGLPLELKVSQQEKSVSEGFQLQEVKLPVGESKSETPVSPIPKLSTNLMLMTPKGEQSSLYLPEKISPKTFGSSPLQTESLMSMSSKVEVVVESAVQIVERGPRVREVVDLTGEDDADSVGEVVEAGRNQNDVSFEEERVEEDG